MTLSFSKFHGCGNSFVILDDRAKKIRSPKKLAKHLCSAHFGIGADGLILLRPSKTDDFRMLYLNSDGSEVEMCGNGIRCLAGFVHHREISNEKILKFETGAGTIKTELIRCDKTKSYLVRVNMGSPAFSSRDLKSKELPATAIKIGKREFTFVSMGNPHAVTFVNNFDFDLKKEGQLVEQYRKLFPNKTNVEFVKVMGPRKLKMRVWERGCGVTLACATGACASVVAATIHEKLKDGEIEVLLDGGKLRISWDDSDTCVHVVGPAVLVADGWLPGTKL